MPETSPHTVREIVRARDDLRARRLTTGAARLDERLRELAARARPPVHHTEKRG